MYFILVNSNVYVNTIYTARNGDLWSFNNSHYAIMKRDELREEFPHAKYEVVNGCTFEKVES